MEKIANFTDFELDYLEGLEWEKKEEGEEADYYLAVVGKVHICKAVYWDCIVFGYTSKWRWRWK